MALSQYLSLPYLHKLHKFIAKEISPQIDSKREADCTKKNNKKSSVSND